MRRHRVPDAAGPEHRQPEQQLRGATRCRHDVRPADRGPAAEPRATYTTRRYSLYGIVDRIGAGDAFAASALHGLIAGFDPQKTLDVRP
jgi:sugar/nucleoside kinase (ribokinase family)